MNNLVSVVIPVYNSAQFVADSIDSVLCQSYDNIQLVIVNDGSTDTSDKIINNYLNDKRIKYYCNSNMGASAARNFGIANSDGIYIAFLDSDDVWASDKLEKQMVLFDELSIDVVYSKRVNIDVNGNIISNRDIKKYYSGNILDVLYIDNFICMSSTVIKKEVFQRVGLFNEALKMSEDYEFWLRVASECTFGFLNEYLVKYRIHDEQASSRYLERLEAIEYIYNNLDKNIMELLSSKTISRSKKLHCCNWAWYYRKNNDKLNAIKMYIRAMKIEPYDFRIIKSMIACLFR